MSEDTAALMRAAATMGSHSREEPLDWLSQRRETCRLRTGETGSQSSSLLTLLTTLSKDSPEVHRHLEARALKGRVCTEPVPLTVTTQAYLLKLSPGSGHSLNSCVRNYVRNTSESSS